MPDQAVTAPAGTAIVGLFGKMPAHGDFVRRGLPPQVVQRLDDWLQAEFGRAQNPSEAIAAMRSLRLASIDIEPGTLALGAMVSSHDKVGRRYPLVAVRLSAYLEATIPQPVPTAWDDWCRGAEQHLVNARDDGATADATFANFDPWEVSAANAPDSDDGLLGTSVWRTGSESNELLEISTDGLPRGADFDRLVTP